MEPEALWTAADVATYLKVSRKTVYNWAEAGTLPHLKLGALLRFSPATVRAWADGRSTPQGSSVVSLMRR